MYATFHRIADVIGASGRRQFLLLLFLVFVGGLFELIGVAAVIPVLSLAVDPESAAADFLSKLGLSQAQFYLCVAIFFAIKSAYLIAQNYLLYQFAYGHVAAIRMQLHDRYLTVRRSEALLQHNAVKLKNIGENADRLARVVIVSAINFLVETFIVTGLVVYAVIMLPAVFLGQLVAGSLLLVAAVLLLGRRVKAWGRDVNRTYENLLKISKENIEGARELNLFFAVDKYKAIFKREVIHNSNRQALFFAVNSAPRIILEFGVVCMLLALAATLRSGGAGIDDLLMLGVVLIRAYPSVGRVISTANALHFGDNLLTELVDVLKTQVHSEATHHRDRVSLPSVDGGGATGASAVIRMKGVEFTYPGKSDSSLKATDVYISEGVTGVIGPSGAGKSTLLDILMGVSEPQRGKVELLDGPGRPIRSVTDCRTCYVAQKPHLFNGSIIENIALGIEKNQIDVEWAEKTLEIVGLNNSSAPDLAFELNTQVGEHAGLLSGGQGQRIALARALYFKPEILIMDEATSAVDSETEEKILRWITQQSQIKFLIMSTHDRATLRFADKVLCLTDGVVGLADSGGQFDQQLPY